MLFTLTMDRNIDSIKEYISRCLRTGDNTVKFEFIEGLTDGKFNVDLVEFYLRKIKEFYPEKEFDYSITYVMKNTDILDSDKCKELEKIDNLFRDRFNKELLLCNDKDFMEYGFRKTLNANRNLESIADKIKNATNNGEPLSPFEKFMLAYEYVTEFVYNEGDDENHLENSHWVPVLEGDKIICGGYSSLLRELCNRIFTEKEVVVLPQYLGVIDTEDNSDIGHANNLVLIKDEKYNIDGLFYCDACWDSKKNDQKWYLHCCIPIKDVLYLKSYKLKFIENITDLYLRQFQEYIKDSEGLEKDIEEYLTGLVFENERKCLIDGNVDLEEYEQPSLAIYGIEEIDDYEDKINDHYNERFAHLIKKYENLSMLKISEEFIDRHGFNEMLDKLISGTFTDEEFEKMYEELASALYAEEKPKKDIKIPLSETFNEYISFHYVNSRMQEIKSKFIREKEKEIIELRRENAKRFLSYINSITSSIVPIEAFINHFKFIGKLKGLRGEELKHFVEEKIQENIEMCTEEFETCKCRGCFASAGRNKKLSI